MCATSGVSLNEMVYPLLCSIHLYASWKVNRMVGVGVAILYHEVSAEDSRTTKKKGAWASDILLLGLFPTRDK